MDTAALGHDWGEPETVSATCTEGGLVKKTCKRDPSHVETVTSGPLGHDWEEDFTVDVQPTCETDGSKSRHCTRCDEKTDVTEIPAPGHDSSWTCSIDVTVEAPKCGTVVEKRKTYSPEPPPVVTTPEDAPYWLLRSQHPESTDACWCTVDGKTFTGTIIGGQTYCAEFYLEPKAGSPFFVPDEEDIRDHLTIHGGALGSLKRYTKNIEFNVLVTAVHDYDENGICRGCGVADHEHSFEEVWSTDESSHWHACAQDGCTATEDLEAHSFGEDNATCETCGYVRTITCQHDFGTYLCDDEQHWKECRKPGCNVVISRGKHTLSPSYRNGVLEYWWCQTCNSYETHEHDIADEWKTSGSHHWKQCFVSSGYCKFVSDYAEHVYDSETGTECVTCGYTRTICGHTYSEGFNSWDETGHWRECTNPVCTDRSGSQKDKAAHTFNSYGDCTVCGYRHTEHAYGEWHYDGSEHWKTCTKPGCQAQTGKSGHTYSGDICSVCGYDRSITPAHTHYYGEWSRDSRNHWRECTDPNCPEETGRIIDRDAHVYDDDADTTCDLCDYVRSIAPDHSGGHVYGDWSWDVNSHWHECTDPDCPDKAGSVKDKASHVYDDDHDYDCNVCGYVRSTRFSHTHTFDGWQYNAERHYRICSAKYCPYRGEKMDSAPHVYDDDQDEFCNVCAYGRFGTQHEHTYGDWTADGETGHYRVCAAENCPYADKGRVTEAHSYDDDADMICDTCGYDRTVTPPAEYTVRFNANGGGGTMADVTGVSGSYTLPACGFTEPEGKQFKGWSTSADGSVISGTTYEVSSDTTFYAIWESKEYSIIVTDGKATIGAGSEISKAAQGTTITLTANAAPDGKVFDKWVVESGSTTLEDANSETTTFIMPDSEVSVKATYKNAPVTTYSLTTQVNGGHGTISASKTGLTEGSTETVIFTPDDGYEIDIVTVNGVATDVLSNILNVTMDADKTVIVTYKAIPHTHTYDQEIQKPETLKSAADCTNDEVYFKSCSCGEISTTETFTAAGTQLGHAWASDWSKDTDNHWKECSRCHEKKDEAAHDYGSDNICDTCGYNKTVPHTHNLTLVPAKAPTCTEKGNTAYYTCDGCDKWFEDATGASEITDKTSVILAATGHSASDWKSDNTDHWKECTVVGCGVIIEDSKAAHTAGEWIIDTPATDTTDGSKHKECTVCGYTMATETIPATGGGEHTHSYGSEWKNDADNHWHECSCGDKKDTAAHTAGEWIIDTPATATTSGSKHKECTVCGYTMTTETIPATGGGEHTHSYGSEWKNDADNHWHECSCGDKKDTAAHTAGEWIIDTPATATTSGSKHKECTVCGYTMTTETIPATGGEHTHNYGSEWKNDADNHWHECSCGDKADKAAHDFKWVVDKEATATQKGSKHEECKVCGYKKAAVEIPATGTPTEPGKPTGPDSPQTGDNSNMILWIALLFISGGAVIGITAYSKKKKENAE
ncbi:MAG: InlB B-repeat-containing protein [Coprococcus catus]